MAQGHDDSLTKILPNLDLGVVKGSIKQDANVPHIPEEPVALSPEGPLAETFSTLPLSTSRDSQLDAMSDNLPLNGSSPAPPIVMNPDGPSEITLAPAVQSAAAQPATNPAARDPSPTSTDSKACSNSGLPCLPVLSMTPLSGGTQDPPASPTLAPITPSLSGKSLSNLSSTGAQASRMPHPTSTIPTLDQEPSLNQADSASIFSNVNMPGIEAAADFLSVDPTGEAGEASMDKRDGAKDTDASSMWGGLSQGVTGFAVASSKRNSDFHALFPSVPEDDFLIESYGCAISRELLIQGRMYLSEAHLCFNSNIFGWVTSVVIAFADIISIEKRNTAYVIPNAISVRTAEGRTLFSSLGSRDTVYSMMMDLWRTSAPNAAAQQAEMTTDEEQVSEDDVKDAEEDSAAGKDPSMSDAREGAPASGDDEAATAHKRRSKLKQKLAIKNKRSQKKGAAAAAASDSGPGQDHDNDADDETDTDSAGDHPATTCDCDASKSHLSNVVYDDTIAMTPRQLYDCIFRSEFYAHFLKDNQKLLDVEVGPWGSDVTQQGATAARKLTYVKPLSGPVGPKQTKCQITDEQLHLDFDKYCTVLTITRTPDVPSGHNFAVHTRTCLTWAEHGHTRLLVTCDVEWSGRSMLRSVIDKASIEGQRSYYRDLAAAIRQHLGEHSEGGGGGAGSKRSSKRSDKAKHAAAASGDATPAQEKPNPDSKSGSSAQDNALTFLTSMMDSFGISPLVLVLLAVIIVLLIINITVYMRGPTGPTRDPANPHRLLRTGRAQKPSMGLRHIGLLVDEEVQDVLDALAYSRSLTETLETDLRELQELIHRHTKQGHRPLPGT